MAAIKTHAASAKVEDHSDT
ncbi:MAG TPA: hypothetical protein VE485_06590 [Mycobacterium sp.]|nr:hypothetical protein [Mycobacterium sp.]